MLNNSRISKLILCVCCVSVFQGCTTIVHPNPADPWEGMNRDILSFNDEVDKYILKPTAKGYQWITPNFVDVGISNFFSNLKDIGVTVNDFLQAKPKHS